jgi:hypothetical protein
MLQFKLLIIGLPSWRPGFDSRSSQVGFVVDKVALGRIFSDNFGSSYSSSYPTTSSLLSSMLCSLNNDSVVKQPA